ncbi:DUF418 domain-containing protein [Novosphingobium sp.]|uniref:DUF418 domain-containing protein n=1 Tax=Novosphingobium sp. TaxID=1874826 RepID=UPI0025E96262|nr:DUF418 domain-containing protein [Novosphingobium sp.]MCC6926987.1 DUF418 domain-containing protein [Novosphingobium sp.]
MTASPAASRPVTLAPVRGKDRIAVLDVLRGIAILGILFMNLPPMAGPISAFIGDFRAMGWAPHDQSVWLFLQTFWDGTQRGVLELLFGAGLMVTAAKAMHPDGPVEVADLYIRRNLWLLAFGLFDVFGLLWFGDILHVYALCALALFPFRKLAVRWLLLLALIVPTADVISGGVEYYQRAALQQTYQAAIANQAEGLPVSPEQAAAISDWNEELDRINGRDPEERRLVREEQQARAGSFADYAGFWIATYKYLSGNGLLLGSLTEAFCTMLLGIALWKLGFIQGQRSTRDYLIVLVLAYGFGLTARYWGGLERMTFQPIPKTIWMTTEYARVAVSLGHVALINLLMQLGAGRALLKPFIAAGQMAFSLYFLEQFIGIYVMYSPLGLHLPGAQGWAHVSQLAGLVVIGLLVFANLWMRWFVSGPLEWVWRSLSYCRRQPFLRRAES